VSAAAGTSSRPDLPGTLVRRLAVASLVANIGIVVTGGAVRLTASGLGCPTWPRCTEQSFVNAPEYGIHGMVEFGNRLLTLVLVAVALATLIAAIRDRSRRSDLRWLAAALLFGIPLQALIGGFTVLTQLNPWVVMLHFLCSMLLIGLATVLVRRSREPAGARVRVVPPAVRALAVGLVVVLAVVLYLGAVVTGSGPHAGDADAPRNGLDPMTVSQLHADAVFLLVGLTVGALVAIRAVGTPAAVQRAVLVLLGLELAQGAVGYVQYLTGLPIVLVNLHMLGASLLVVAAVTLVMTTRPPAVRPVPAAVGERSRLSRPVG
jgi:heme a synthase